MSARFASPLLPTAVPANPNTTYPSAPSTVSMNHAPTHMAVGPPPGLGYLQGLPINHAGNNNGAEPPADPSKVQPPLLNSECLSFVLGEGVPGQSTERRAFSAEILSTTMMLNECVTIDPLPSFLVVIIHSSCRHEFVKLQETYWYLFVMMTPTIHDPFPTYIHIYCYPCPFYLPLNAHHP